MAKNAKDVDLKATIAKVRKKDHNFACCLAKDGCVLNVDVRHSPDKLFTDAKKMPGAKSAGTQGVMKIEGSAIKFECHTEIPGGIEPKFKQYLTKQGVKGMTVEFAMSDKGDSPPEPEAGADGASSAQAGEAQSPDAQTDGDAADDQDLSKEELLAEWTHINSIMELSYPTWSEKDAKEMKGAMKTIKSTIDQDDLVGGRNMLNKVMLLTGVSPSSPVQAISFSTGGGRGKAKDKNELTKQFKDLMPELKKVIDSSAPGPADELRKLAKSFGDIMKKGELEEAQAKFDEIESKMGAVAAAREERAQERIGRLASARKKAADALAQL